MSCKDEKLSIAGITIDINTQKFDIKINNPTRKYKYNGLNSALPSGLSIVKKENGPNNKECWIWYGNQLLALDFIDTNSASNENPLWIKQVEFKVSTDPENGSPLDIVLVGKDSENNEIFLTVERESIPVVNA